jgi:hypothetical protein
MTTRRTSSASSSKEVSVRGPFITAVPVVEQEVPSFITHNQKPPTSCHVTQPGATEKGLCEKTTISEQFEHVWAPWKRRDGWTGWGNESVSTAALVPALVVQAFSTGILDATTYADFNTFASNRESSTSHLALSRALTLIRDWQYNPSLCIRIRDTSYFAAPHWRIFWRFSQRSLYLWSSRTHHG